MMANQADFPISRMSSVLGVSRSGYYASRTRPPSAWSVADERLRRKIVNFHDASKQTYGAPRIHADLADEGIRVGRKRVERLMKGAGIAGVILRRIESDSLNGVPTVTLR